MKSFWAALSALVVTMFVTCEALADAGELVVDSDEPRLTKEAISKRLTTDLGDELLSKTSISIRYRIAGQVLDVRVVRADGKTFQRTINAQGEPADVENEAVLLASNLARDEASSLIDELNAHAAKANVKPPVEEPTPPPPPPPVVGIPEERWAATFGVVYPLATNWGHPNVRAPFNFGLFYSRVGTSSGFQLGSLVAHTSRGVQGSQIGGLVAVTGGTVEGSQIATVASYAGKNVEGAQISIACNYGAGTVTGLQIGSLNVAADGGSNVRLGHVNIAGGNSTGFQGAAGLNVNVGSMKGLQMATMNVAQDVEGVQIGIVNVGRKVKGFQMGLINIAEEVDEAIGMVTIAKNTVHPIVWGTNLAFANFGARFTTNHIYTMFGIGLGTRETNFDAEPLFNFGLGSVFKVYKDFDVNPELAYSIIDLNQQTNQSLHPKLLAGYTFAPRFRVFAGGGPRVPVSFDRGSPVVRPEFVGGLQF